MDNSSDAGTTLRIDEVAEATATSVATLRRWRDLGLLSSRGDALSPRDVERTRAVQFVERRGIAPETVARACETQGDLLGPMAEAEARLFHYYVHEQPRAEGLAGRELTAATTAVSKPLSGLIEPAVLFFHRKAYQRALREDLLLHLAQDPPAPHRRPGRDRDHDPVRRPRRLHTTHPGRGRRRRGRSDRDRASRSRRPRALWPGTWLYIHPNPERGIALPALCPHTSPTTPRPSTSDERAS